MYRLEMNMHDLLNGLAALGFMGLILGLIYVVLPLAAIWCLVRVIRHAWKGSPAPVVQGRAPVVQGMAPEIYMAIMRRVLGASTVPHHRVYLCGQCKEVSAVTPSDERQDDIEGVR